MTVECQHQPLAQEFIFEHLMKLLKTEDLLNCRLVCHGWRDAIKFLPIPLLASRYYTVQEVMRSFPGAKAMSVEIKEGESAANVFGQLTSARNLRQLSIRSLTPWTDLDAATSYFPSLATLEALSLNWHNKERCPDIYTSLQHFTNLTRLELTSSIKENSALEVLSQLRKLKDLRLRLITHVHLGDDLFLPLLTHVTRLDVDIERRRCSRTCNVFEADSWRTNPCSVFVPFSLQLVVDYRHTLRSLAFAFPKRQDRFYDMSVLASFSRLEELRVYSRQEDVILQGRTNLLAVLEHMRHLTRLDFDLATGSMHAILQAVAPLTSLKRLRCKRVYAGRDIDFAPRSLSALTQLTSLCLSRAPARMSLRGMFRLVELEIDSEAENIRNLERSLKQMPRLKRLSLGFGEKRRTDRSRDSLIRLMGTQNLHTRYVCMQK